MKTSSWTKSIRLLSLVVFLLLNKQIMANNVQNNKNQVTNFFDQAIEDRNGLEANLEHSKQEAESGIGANGALQSLGVDGGVIEGKTSELSVIDAKDLENRGQRERAKPENQYYEQVEINYSNPQILNEKRDIELISSSSEKLVSKLIDGFKDFGVDCQNIEGSKEVEVENFISIKKEQQQDEIYEQKMCEELKNKYVCTDSVTLTCKLTGKRYDGWQDREIALDGHMLYWNYMDWGWSIKWKRKRHGWHIHKYHPIGIFGGGSESALRDNPQAINDQARSLIARQLGVGIDQIYEDITFPEAGRGIGEIRPLNSRWRVAWDQYLFRYKYRDSHLFCAEWQEEWQEDCRLQQ